MKAATAHRDHTHRLWRAAALLFITLRRNGALGLTLCAGVLLSLGWLSVSRDWERQSLQTETRNLVLERIELLRGRTMMSSIS